MNGAVYFLEQHFIRFTIRLIIILFDLLLLRKTNFKTLEI